MTDVSVGGPCRRPSVVATLEGKCIQPGPGSKLKSKRDMNRAEVVLSACCAGSSAAALKDE